MNQTFQEKYRNLLNLLSGRCGFSQRMNNAPGRNRSNSPRGLRMMASIQPSMT